MKKTALSLLGIAALATLGFTACNSGDCQGACKGDKAELYTGIVPAADVDGTVYTLKLEFDDDNNYTEGDFTLVENSVVLDSTVVQGFREVATAYSKGDFKKQSKQVNGASVDYIVLMPEAKDALGVASNSSTYFVMNADGTLTMVNADLEQPTYPELYTLSKK